MLTCYAQQRQSTNEKFTNNLPWLKYGITRDPWCWYIYLHDWAISWVNVGVHIPAPWSIWVVRFLLLNFPIFVAEQFIDWGPYKRLDIFGFL